MLPGPARIAHVCIVACTNQRLPLPARFTYTFLRLLLAVGCCLRCTNVFRFCVAETLIGCSAYVSLQLEVDRLTQFVIANDYMLAASFDFLGVSLMTSGTGVTRMMPATHTAQPGALGCVQHRLQQCVQHAIVNNAYYCAAYRCIAVGFQQDHPTINRRLKTIYSDNITTL